MLRIPRGGSILSRAFRTAFSSPLSTSQPLQQSCRWQRVPQPSLPIRNFSSLLRLRQQAEAQEHESSTPPPPPQHLTLFSELAEHGIVSPKVINTIVNDMGIHTMTDIQRLTINECLDGADVIAQAKTGTGKTLAFLMPIVQRILQDPSLENRGRYGDRASASDIRALIISPTRELAEQIAVEAKKIVRGTAVKVQTAVGGTQKSMHLRMMQREGCHILVGTPGRVKDILSDGYSDVRLDNIETFVLDEADRLLDIGFLPEIEDIQSFMPPREERQRQTLMFSATIPSDVVSLVRRTLRPDFKFIRTVDPDEAPTHERIPQHVVFLHGLQNQMPVILELAMRAQEAHKSDPANNMSFKAIVYFGSTNEVTLAANIFENLREPGSGGQGRHMYSSHPLAGIKILEMHSKLTQQARTRNSENFRRAESALLFSSDVTARGMDFPNVSHVIQMGLPRNANDYVHRIGRTGRAGKPGEGWLMLSDDERSEYRKKMGHSGIKILESKVLQTAQLDMTQPTHLPAHVARIMEMVEGGVKMVPYSTKAQTYTSLLGVLGQSGRGHQQTIDLMNDLAKYGWGLEKPPSLNPSLVAKLGFSRCRGIELEERGFRGRDESSRGGRGGAFSDRDPFGDRAGSRNSFGDRSGGFGGGRGGDSRGYDGDRGRGGFGGSRDRRGHGGGRDRGDFGGARR